MWVFWFVSSFFFLHGAPSWYEPGVPFYEIINVWREVFFNGLTSGCTFLPLSRVPSLQKMIILSINLLFYIRLHPIDKLSFEQPVCRAADGILLTRASNARDQ